MAVRAEEIASILREQIEGFSTKVVATDVGRVITAGDGVARIYGLTGARYSEHGGRSSLILAQDPSTVGNYCRERGTWALTFDPYQA